MDKRCVTCEHWGAGRYSEWAPCCAPLPFYVELEKTERTYKNDGTTCPCWKAKESEGDNGN